jgi:hypothetical protein
MTSGDASMFVFGAVYQKIKEHIIEGFGMCGTWLGSLAFTTRRSATRACSSRHPIRILSGTMRRGICCLLCLLGRHAARLDVRSGSGSSSQVIADFVACYGEAKGG